MNILDKPCHNWELNTCMHHSNCLQWKKCFGVVICVSTSTICSFHSQYLVEIEYKGLLLTLDSVISTHECNILTICINYSVHVLALLHNKFSKLWRSTDRSMEVTRSWILKRAQDVVPARRREDEAIVQSAL